MVLGMIGLCSALSLSAQDDAIEKKPEGVAVEQPEDSAPSDSALRHFCCDS